MSKKQRTAIESAHKTLLAGRAPDEPRRLGVFAGLVKVAEDFDAPLPDEDAWWGASTNEWGISTEDR
ncbi:MAG: hypothetical protein D6790_05345 [Caldilineae bacterium]|nr:MAG: hypothetical protein D6790_05345 [Caldilineae bacterium]